ncbi:hypothetical protein DFH07DRAFT_1035955 [Mycena maculata]|uniref:Uncharacterized protein n=1 Tax=Mycena maculata TaxID=230809 RepID=A0AAD7IQS4_9AGAR|nr:hypothetical protein DFH07DRAFT_1035955 [Mycena maculata]
MSLPRAIPDSEETNAPVLRATVESTYGCFCVKTFRRILACSSATAPRTRVRAPTAARQDINIVRKPAEKQKHVQKVFARFPSPLPAPTIRWSGRGQCADNLKSDGVPVPHSFQMKLLVEHVQQKEKRKHLHLAPSRSLLTSSPTCARHNDRPGHGSQFGAGGQHVVQETIPFTFLGLPYMLELWLSRSRVPHATPRAPLTHANAGFAYITRSAWNERQAFLPGVKNLRGRERDSFAVLACGHYLDLFMPSTFAFNSGVLLSSAKVELSALRNWLDGMTLDARPQTGSFEQHTPAEAQRNQTWLHGTRSHDSVTTNAINDWPIRPGVAFIFHDHLYAPSSSALACFFLSQCSGMGLTGSIGGCETLPTWYNCIKGAGAPSKDERARRCFRGELFQIRTKTNDALPPCMKGPGAPSKNESARRCLSVRFSQLGRIQMIPSHCVLKAPTLRGKTNVHIDVLSARFSELGQITNTEHAGGVPPATPSVIARATATAQTAALLILDADTLEPHTERKTLQPWQARRRLTDEDDLDATTSIRAEGKKTVYRVYTNRSWPSHNGSRTFSHPAAAADIRYASARRRAVEYVARGGGGADAHCRASGRACTRKVRCRAAPLAATQHPVRIPSGGTFKGFDRRVVTWAPVGEHGTSSAPLVHTPVDGDRDKRTDSFTGTPNTNTNTFSPFGTNTFSLLAPTHPRLGTRMLTYATTTDTQTPRNGTHRQCRLDPCDIVALWKERAPVCKSPSSSSSSSKTSSSTPRHLQHAIPLVRRSFAWLWHHSDCAPEHRSGSVATGVPEKLECAKTCKGFFFGLASFMTPHPWDAIPWHCHQCGEFARANSAPLRNSGVRIMRVRPLSTAGDGVPSYIVHKIPEGHTFIAGAFTLAIRMFGSAAAASATVSASAPHRRPLYARVQQKQHRTTPWSPVTCGGAAAALVVACTTSELIHLRPLRQRDFASGVMCVAVVHNVHKSADFSVLPSPTLGQGGLKKIRGKWREFPQSAQHLPCRQITGNYRAVFPSAGHLPPICRAGRLHSAPSMEAGGGRIGHRRRTWVVMMSGCPRVGQWKEGIVDERGTAHMLSGTNNIPIGSRQPSASSDPPSEGRYSSGLPPGAFNREHGFMEVAYHGRGRGCGRGHRRGCGKGRGLGQDYVASVYHRDTYRPDNGPDNRYASPPKEAEGTDCAGSCSAPGASPGHKEYLAQFRQLRELGKTVLYLGHGRHFPFG